MSIKLKPGQLHKDLEKRMRNLKVDTEKATRKAMFRGKALLTRRTPVDTGQMKNSWQVKGDILLNDAPHAGVIEEGARPHKVSKEGIEAIARWAQRRLGVSEEEARGVAFGVARKLAKEGQKGHYIVRDAMDELRSFVVKEIVAEIRAQAGKKA